MTPYTFDTLEASKRLREAGMNEGVAEAVVAVFQHATTAMDFSQLATKADIADMATKADIADMATKADIADMATKADIANMATKADIADMATKADLERFATREDLFELSARLGEKLMAHTLALGGLAISLFGGAVAIMVVAS